MAWTVACVLSLTGQTGCDCSGTASTGDGGAGDRDGAAPRDGALGRDGGGGGFGDGGLECGTIAAVVRDFDVSHPDFEDENPGLVEGLVMTTSTPSASPSTRTARARGRHRQRGHVPSVVSNHRRREHAVRHHAAAHRRDPGPLRLRQRSLLPGRRTWASATRAWITKVSSATSTSRPRSTPASSTRAAKRSRSAATTTCGSSSMDSSRSTSVECTAPTNGRSISTRLGLTPGGRYHMDIFHAERHTQASNFRIETTIECFVDPILI